LKSKDFLKSLFQHFGLQISIFILQTDDLLGLLVVVSTDTLKMLKMVTRTYIIFVTMNFKDTQFHI